MQVTFTVRSSSSPVDPLSKPVTTPVTVHFLSPAGEKQTCIANVGESLLDVTLREGIDLEGF